MLYELIFLSSFLSPLLISFIFGGFIFRFLENKNFYSAEESKKTTMYGEKAVCFEQITKENKGEKKGVRMGGLLIHPSVLITSGILFYLTGENLFLLFGFVYLCGAILGLIDDLIDLKILKLKTFKLSYRLLSVFVLAIIFSFLLERLSEGSFLFAYGEYNLYTHLFTIFTFCIWYGGAIMDGIDGLVMGVVIPIFASIALIGGIVGNLPVSLIALTILCSLFYFSQKNVSGDVYLTETGMMPITFSLAFLSLLLTFDNNLGFVTVSVMGVLFYITWMSVILQLTYRKITKKKLFLITPIHHHFQAKHIQDRVIVNTYFLITLILCVAIILLYSSNLLTIL